MLHAVIGVAITIFEKGKPTIDRYVKKNASTHIQRILGFLAIFCVARHMNAYGYFTDEWVYILNEPTLYGFICQVALAIVAGLHLMIGFPRAMITVGYIRNPQEIKNQKNFVYVMVCATWFVGIYGACNYFGII